MWGFIIIVLVGVNFFTARIRDSRRLREARSQRDESATDTRGG
jgi:hypothetical protein